MGRKSTITSRYGKGARQSNTLEIIRPINNLPEKIRIRLRIMMMDLVTAWNDNLSITLEKDDPHTERELDSEVKEGAVFESWLESQPESEIREFVQSLEKTMSLPDEKLIPHLVQNAKSLCDTGDQKTYTKLENLSSPHATPPPFHHYGTSRRPIKKRLRVRETHYQRFERKRSERIDRLEKSKSLQILREKLQSISLSQLLTLRGKKQPSIEQSLQYVAEAEDYLYVPNEIAELGLCVEDATGNIIFDLLPTNTISETYIQHLETTFDNLCATIPKSLFEKDDKRFSKPCDPSQHHGVLHLGVWNQSTSQHERPAYSKGFRAKLLDYKDSATHEKIRAFLQENEILFRHVGGIFKRMDPELFEKYNMLELPPMLDKTLFWPFCMLALNRNCTSLPHKDLNDLSQGFCFLLCWGDFTGAEMTFRELGLKIPFKRGQILIFRSSLLTHWNQIAHGIRHSMVLFTPARMFDWKNITTNQVLNRWKRERDACIQKLQKLNISK